jgi:hypothetical protein
MPDTSALPELQADTGDESAGAPDSGRDAVHDAPRDAERGSWLLDDLEEWQLSYIREAEAMSD